LKKIALGNRKHKSTIEEDFKRELKQRYDLSFNHLFTITNIPIGRFLKFLHRSRNFKGYMNRLIAAYNPEAAAGVMCRNTLSISWDSGLYDCDFNQMLGMCCDHGAPTHIPDFDMEKIRTRRIVTGLHCYGCTAGCGSSCGGAVTE
jgi:radical SAM/Cys-rich protein